MQLSFPSAVRRYMWVFDFGSQNIANPYATNLSAPNILPAGSNVDVYMSPVYKTMNGEVWTLYNFGQPSPCIPSHVYLTDSSHDRLRFPQHDHRNEHVLRHAHALLFRLGPHRHHDSLRPSILGNQPPKRLRQTRWCVRHHQRDLRHRLRQDRLGRRRWYVLLTCPYSFWLPE